MLRFTCPHCRKALKVPVKFAGRMAHCPLCQGEVTIPNETQPPESEPGAADSTSRETTFPADISVLQNAADRRTIRTSLRAAGLGSFIFGGIAIYMGITNRHVSPMNLVLAALGVMLILEGLWISLRPGPNGFSVNGITLILVGVWNLVVTFINSLNPNQSISVFWFMLGFFQIAWGIYSMHRRYQFGDKPETDIRDIPEWITTWVNRAVADVKKANAKKRNDVVTLTGKQRFGEMVPQTWNLRMQSDGAVLATTAGEADVLFLSPDQLRLEVLNPPRPGKTPLKNHKVILHAGSRRIKGTMRREQCDRLTDWLTKGYTAGGDVASPAAFPRVPAVSYTSSPPINWFVETARYTGLWIHDRWKMCVAVLILGLLVTAGVFAHRHIEQARRHYPEVKKEAREIVSAVMRTFLSLRELKPFKLRGGHTEINDPHLILSMPDKLTFFYRTSRTQTSESGGPIHIKGSALGSYNPRTHSLQCRFTIRQGLRDRYYDLRARRISEGDDPTWEIAFDSRSEDGPKEYLVALKSKKHQKSPPASRSPVTKPPSALSLPQKESNRPRVK